MKNRRMQRVVGFVCALLLAVGSRAQTTTNGWLVLNHQQKISGKWSLLLDAQIRSADRFDYVETVLIRPALQCKISEQHSVAAGYAYIGNWGEEDGRKMFDLEHRAWQQYNLKLMAGNVEINNRVRLEQRFLQADKGFDFAQRLRHYIRSQVPLVKEKEFTKGGYVAVQNEVFLNILNAEVVNNRFFDQNRLYGSLGYRFSKKLDVEAGYLYRYQIEEEKLHNHIIQVMISTTF